MTRILVCQAGSCRRRGSEAVLLEIEDLASAMSLDGGCPVEASGCLGLCSQAPGVALVAKRAKTRYFTRVDTLADSIRVVETATGTRASEDLREALAARPQLRGARAIRKREHAMSVFRWNDALQATMDQMAGGGATQELVDVYEHLLKQAGYGVVLPSNEEPLPDKIANYTRWTVENVVAVSRHSAVFRLGSCDRKRGTPNPRGGGRPMPVPKTWHTTLLAPIGRQSDGPLPWIERDYTPISSAKQWEKGECDILIKIYRDGAATSWLHRTTTSASNASTTTAPTQLWLSQPVQTLTVPALVPVSGGASRSANDVFQPASVLLLLAGTGVVALPQILDHRDPYNKIGVASKRSNQLHVPIDLVLSCRSDDVLMLPSIIEYCQQAASSPIKGLRNFTLLLTRPQEGTSQPDKQQYPYSPVSSEKDFQTLRGLPNASIFENKRLSLELVSTALSNMPEPCRVVVSGPSGFNAASREFLLQTGNIEDDAITILEA